jgi:hypothetical protein
MAKDKSDWDLTADEDKDRIGGGPGASDANSGAGNATGIPDAETGMNAEDVVNKGDVDEDREKLFPEARHDGPNPGAQSDEDVDRSE